MLTPLAVIGGATGLTLALAWLGQGRLATKDGEGTRFKGITALRAFAALGVVASHTMATSPLAGLPRLFVENMATGVALFFVISGFLLYRPFANSLTDRSRVKIWHFALNRALRIVPLYFLAVLIVFLATWDRSDQSLLRLAHALTFTGVETSGDLIPVAWSLDDEMAFYLLLPVLYLVLMAWPKPQQRLWLGVFVIGALSLLSLATLAMTPSDQAITGGPLTKFHLFGFGMLLGSFRSRWPQYEPSTRALVIGGAGILVLLTASGLAYDRHMYVFSPLCGLAFFLVVGTVAFSGKAATVPKALSWRPLVFLGDVSYGIYLWHEPIHHVLFNSGLLSSSYIPGLLELACCTVALATGTYFAIEKPALRIKNRWTVSAGSRRMGRAVSIAQPKGASAA
ncbi:MAG TPA: acyltransferase [Candidatus Dormibacteraeota bacterium]|nr:acyltransferase [Candidatus Dormibacteraeota bacterium]